MTRFRCLALVLLVHATSLSPAAQTSSRLELADPKPEDAARAILAAFRTYQVVGMNAAHNLKDQDDFILSFIRRPDFPAVVNDLVIECGNSLYQPTLDRYIRGEEVSLSVVRQVWANTTQTMCNVSAFYDQLFPLVRAINRRLAPEKRLRVLAGDPPIDWRAVKSTADAAYFDQFLEHRDANVAAVLEREVFAKRRKALMLFGGGHLFHGVGTNAVGLNDKRHPNATLVIYTHASYGCQAPPSKENDQLEARMASWPVPTVARIKGTWLGDVAMPLGPSRPLSELADAYLYLGPRDLALAEPTPALFFLDKEAVGEMDRRTKMNVGLFAGNVDPVRVREKDAKPVRCGADAGFR